MKYKKRIAAACAATLLFSLLTGADTAGQQEAEPVVLEVSIVQTSLAQIDNTRWNYQAEDDVYWQVGISYCENPVAEEYETLGIFVPAAYMTATENGDGTYTCVWNPESSIGAYTAATAPIVIPVNTPGYAAMSAPTGYVSGAADYTNAGFIYVNAGCRGRNEGAPSGITDLKAAVRYLRYNEGNIPGSMERIFTFGMSGGGAQSALMGATGNSALYEPYLEAIGAVPGYSDAVAGSMCWCPITNLDYANEAYEWNLGVSRTDLTEEMQQLSNDMAKVFAEYLNELGLSDQQGTILTLTESENGVYQAGSYYDYLKTEIERSLNNFLADTTFPYTPATQGGRGGRGQGRPDGLPGGMTGGFVDEHGQMQDDGIQRGFAEQTPTVATTYETVQDYLDSLNKDRIWITYNSDTNTASITSVEDFVLACKKASKSVGAFDDLNGTQGENTLFGYGDGKGAHFDPFMAALLQDNETYGAAYAEDLEKTDLLGNSVQTRVDMYNPMYYLSSFYEGYQTADVAEYWRIRTGIAQGDTALSTEVNLALALENYGREVDFEMVWGQGHTMAERTGNSTENFIAWVNDCLSE